MRAHEFITEQGVNLNTARSIAKDIDAHIKDMGFHVSQYGRDAHYQRLRTEIQGMLDDLANLGYEYAHDRSDHIMPLTLQNKPDTKVTEAPLPPKAQQVLWRLKHGLNQPGLQLSKPTPGPQQPKQNDPEPAPTAAPEEPLQIAGPGTGERDPTGIMPTGARYPQLQAQIQALERLMQQFVELERLIDRAERQPGGIDRGTAADIEIIQQWPVPTTTEEVKEYAAKIAQGIQIMKSYLQRKRAVWR